jgi:hypothetical protein
MLSWTKKRLGEVHTWPALKNLAWAALRADFTGSASAQTMTGAWPPSSIRHGFMTSPAWAARSLPTGTEPVKATRRIRRRGDQVGGDLGRLAEDQVEDAGRDAGVGEAGDQLGGGARGLLGRLDDDRAAGGQRGGELAHRAAGREVPRHERGDRADRLAADGQHGAGCGRDDPAVGAAGVLDVPAQGVGDPQGLAGASRRGLPCSWVMIRPMSGARSVSRSAAACRIAERLAIGVSRQVRKPSVAASRARSRSAVVASGTSPRTSSVAGLTTGRSVRCRPGTTRPRCTCGRRGSRGRRS